jgi:hypothetical protein
VGARPPRPQGAYSLRRLKDLPTDLPSALAPPAIPLHYEASAENGTSQQEKGSLFQR